MRATGFSSLGPEDSMEKGMATLSRCRAWEILWTEEPGRLHTAHGVAKEWDTNSRLNNSNNAYYIGLL